MINPFSIGDVRAFWDGVASTYEHYNEKVGYVHTQRFEKAMEFGDIRPGMHVLNVWSRTGSLIPWLKKVESVSIENREASPKMMAIAQERYPTESFKLTDLEDFSEFADGSFDRVVSLETLEHVPKPSAFLAELKRVLKPGGMLVMSLPPRGAEIPEFFYLLAFGDHGEGPHRFLWPYEVKRLLREAGLELSLHRRFVMLPFGSDRFVRAAEKVLSALFGRTVIGNFGVRHFYVARKAA